MLHESYSIKGMKWFLHISRIQDWEMVSNYFALISNKTFKITSNSILLKKRRANSECELFILSFKGYIFRKLLRTIGIAKSSYIYIGRDYYELLV